MQLVLQFLLLIVGFVLLVKGADFFVDKKNPRVELVFTREG